VVDAATLPIVADSFSYQATSYAIQERPRGHPGFQLAPCPNAGDCRVGGVAADGGGGGAVLALTQAHLHKPSEHSVNGSRFAFELHLVHTNAASGAVAEVLSVLFPLADAHNKLLDSFLWLVP
jgi:hypothetical protein